MYVSTFSPFNISCKGTLKLTRYLHANCHNDPWCHKLLKYLTRDICIMKRTTNDRNPSRFNTLGPARTLLISCISQKKLCSQSRNWEFRKLTKWRISAQEGSGIPQLLCEQKGVAQLFNNYFSSPNGLWVNSYRLRVVISSSSIRTQHW